MDNIIIIFIHAFNDKNLIQGLFFLLILLNLSSRLLRLVLEMGHHLRCLRHSVLVFSHIHVGIVIQQEFDNLSQPVHIHESDRLSLPIFEFIVVQIPKIFLDPSTTPLATLARGNLLKRVAILIIIYEAICAPFENICNATQNPERHLVKPSHFTVSFIFKAPHEKSNGTPHPRLLDSNVGSKGTDQLLLHLQNLAQLHLNVVSPHDSVKAHMLAATTEQLHDRFTEEKLL
mmetsp:Transcript_159735/g.283076  ORF Transcript_159735/g.283076 Transcript_159735/m.283076 type:complete len:231 (+) Transcript_159735:348-1040(+)